MDVKSFVTFGPEWFTTFSLFLSTFSILLQQSNESFSNSCFESVKVIFHSPEMNVSLIIMYFSITALTACVFLLILKYLKEKPFGQQYLSDQLIITLMVSIFAIIAFLSVALTLREIIGPYSVLVTWFVIAVQQFLQLFVIMSMLSIQVAQFCNIYFASRCQLITNEIYIL